MSDAAPSSTPSPSPGNATNQSQESKDTQRTETRDWHRPEPKPTTLNERVTSTPPKKEAPQRKETQTSEKTDEKKETKTAVRSKEVDDDPEEEWDDGKGGKFKAKRSEIRQAFARKAEIERESHERFRKAAESRKAAEAKENELKGLFSKHAEDPWAIEKAILMKRDGLSEDQAEQRLNEIAEQRLVKQMERARMSPEQIEAERMRQENEQLKAQVAETEKKEKERRYNEAKRVHLQEFDRQIAEALTSTNQPKTRFAAARIAKVLADNFDPESKKSIDPSLAARIARDVHHTEIRHELTELAATNPQAAIDLIGPEIVKFVLKQSAKEHQEFVPQGNTNRPSPPPKPKAPPRPLTLEEARKKNLGINHY